MKYLVIETTWANQLVFHVSVARRYDALDRVGLREVQTGSSS
jgi:hypothetical protein